MEPNHFNKIKVGIMAVHVFLVWIWCRENLWYFGWHHWRPLQPTIHTKYIHRLRNVRVGYVLYRALVIIMSWCLNGQTYSKFDQTSWRPAAHSGEPSCVETGATDKALRHQWLQAVGIGSETSLPSSKPPWLGKHVASTTRLGWTQSEEVRQGQKVIIG